MLITVPSELKVATLNWELERAGQDFNGLYLSAQHIAYPEARWRCTVTLPVMKPESAGKVEALLARVSDRGNHFELGRDDRPVMGAGGSGTVRGAGQTGRSVLVEGYAAGTVIFKAGDMIQLGPNRLHIVTADVTSSPGGILYDEDGNPLLTEDSPPEEILVDGEGRASIPIEPPLQSSPDDGQAVLTGVNAKAVFRLDSSYAVTSTPGIFTGISFNAAQDLNWSE